MTTHPAIGTEAIGAATTVGKTITRPALPLHYAGNGSSAMTEDFQGEIQLEKSLDESTEPEDQKDVQHRT